MASPDRPATALDAPRHAVLSVGYAASMLPRSLAFGGPIALSAFLLFTSEPMVARLAQPVFGGAPAVWATVLVFFQVTLLLGYAYAHLVVTRLSPGRGAVLHVAVAVLAAVLAIAAPRVVTDLLVPGLPTIPNVLLLLAVIVGPATFVMTATTPLVSAWFARDRHARDPGAQGGGRGDPYWLYALSNFGSLVSLLAYPFLIQPLLGLTVQRQLWTAGYAVLVGLLAVAGGRSWAMSSRWRVSEDAPPTTWVLATDTPAPPINTARRLGWILLAAIPSGLLSAVTNLVTTDLLSAPLLWIVPLAIYLATLVVAFSERGRRSLGFITALAPAALTLLWIPLGSTAGWPILPLLLIEYAGLAIVALALHGRLAQDRPPPAGLTGFYFTMSVGGALGGALVGIVAPVLFDGIWEYPILVVAAAALLAGDRRPSRPAGPRRPFGAFFRGWAARVLPYAVVAGLLVLVMSAGRSIALDYAGRWLLVGGLVLLVGGPPRFFAASTAVVLVLATFVLAPAVDFRDRSFFGVVEVRRDVDAGVTVLSHGTTAHGIQWSDAWHREDPGSYYARSGPVGDLFDVVNDRPAMEIRVMGLGAGVLASYARSTDDLVFYEIDPLVVRVARDPGLFTFLRGARAMTATSVGDARYLLRQEASGSLDLVIMDAFTSDAVPVHLITVEALRDVARALRPDGLVAVHVSNRYYDLPPAVAAALEAAWLAPLERAFVPTEDEAARGAAISHWIVAGRLPATLEDLDALGRRGWAPAETGEPLTDDFADLLRLLRLGD